MDRIEVTWNKYFKGTAFIEKYTSSITDSDIIVFINTTFIQYGYISQKDVERIYQILHSVLVFGRDMEYLGIRLYDWERIKRNIPWNKVDSRKKNETALSTGTLYTIYNAVVRENIYPEKRSASLLICLNMFLGLRVGELSALMFSDFDLKNYTLTISRTDSKSYDRDENGNKLDLHYKTGMPKTMVSIRTIPLLPQAVEIYKLIQKHHEDSGFNSKYLCFDGKETIRLRSLDRTLRRLCNLCGVHHFNHHLIRKTFATLLHNKGAPTRVIADILGHSEISTTEKNYILSGADAMRMRFDYMVEAFKTE